VVIDTADLLDFDPRELPPRPREVRVLMADPAYFDVKYVINPFMAANVGTIDHEKACQQWMDLADTYRGLGFPVDVLPPVQGLPDLVFMANQTLPGQLPNGEWCAVLSYMHAPQRRGEVPHVAAWFSASKGRTITLEDPELPFEGMGDAAWWPGRRLLIGGFGVRTARRAYPLLSRIFDVPVLTLALVDPRFYHLDTCLSILDERTALFVPEAFDEQGRMLLEALFERLVPVPFDEAVGYLACNGHSPDGKHFIVDSGARATHKMVTDLGYRVLPVDTSEFRKSGGSVYCMKLMVP
jgi:N-dimethylarginine dimethylaminohydrolase